jgi:hypothetical protein
MKTIRFDSNIDPRHKWEQIKLLMKEFCILYSKTKANDKRKCIKYVET